MNTVTDYSEVVTNTRAFNLGLDQGHDLETLLSYFRAWYYIPELDLVAPSKFIGYKDIDAATYIAATEIDGRETEPILNRWFDRLDENSPEGKYISSKVENLARKYGKNMSRIARFNAPIGWKSSNQVEAITPFKTDKVKKSTTNNDIVEVFWRAYLSLYPEDQRALAEKVIKHQQ